MPSSPLHPCGQAGCTTLLMREDGSRCSLHRRQRKAAGEAHRGSARERGYTAKWDKASAAFLRRCPLCAVCAAQGRVAAATVTDHIVPHKGSDRLFWDSENNWQPLCKPCHDRKTAMEDGGFGRASTPRIPPPAISGPHMCIDGVLYEMPAPAGTRTGGVE